MGVFVLFCPSNLSSFSTTSETPRGVHHELSHKGCNLWPCWCSKQLSSLPQSLGLSVLLADNLQSLVPHGRSERGWHNLNHRAFSGYKLSVQSLACSDG